MKLPIADCRLPIAESAAHRSLARCGHDRGQVIGLLQERGQFGLGNNARFDEQFDPESSLVCFFFNGSDFRNKFRLAPGAAGCAVIRGHRSAAANDLSGDNPPRVIILRNRSRKFNDPEGETFGVLFKFRWIHGSKRQNQSPIANRQSAIPV
jgi:hypothetical protein